MTQENWEYHEGIDYTVVMVEDETTDNAFCHLYGDDDVVRERGALIVGAPKMLKTLELVECLDSIRNDPVVHRDVLAAIAGAKVSQ